MNDSDFEKRLQGQPLRPIPPEWRAEILRQANPESRPSTLDPLARRSEAEAARPPFLSALLWPHPKAWAGLAGVWILIFALRIASQDNRSNLAKTSSPPSQQIAANLKEQQQILAELMGTSGATPEIVKPKRLVPQPHSESRKPTAMA